MGGQRALVGYTGFVGSNLLTQQGFDCCYNSANIADIAGRELELLVFAGAQAKKWWANANPEADWQGIDRAIRCLRQVTATCVVHISTIDVLPAAANGCDEDYDPHGAESHPYGRHRLTLEDFIRERFPAALIVRLPGLFGNGLKKNVIFDLLTDNQLDKINPASAFQYFDLEQLWAAIEVALAARLSLVHLFTEPLATGEILDRFFPEARVGAEALPVAAYDFRTKHAALFNGPPGYVAGREAVLARLGAFIDRWRAEGTKGSAS